MWNNLPVHLRNTDSEHTLSADYWSRTCFAEDSDAYDCLFFERLINLHYLAKTDKNGWCNVVPPSSCNAYNCHVFYYLCACLFGCLSCLILLYFSARIIVVIISSISAYGLYLRISSQSSVSFSSNLYQIITVARIAYYVASLLLFSTNWLTMFLGQLNCYAAGTSRP